MMGCVMIWELVQNSRLQSDHRPIAKPATNVMIGPSASVLTRLGARFVP